MSSLFLGERRAESSIDKASIREPQAVPIEVDRRFARTSVLRFQTLCLQTLRVPPARLMCGLRLASSAASNR
jgi:hypothetical protein